MRATLLQEITLPQPISEQALKELHSRCKQGDVQAKKDLVLHHLRLGMSVAMSMHRSSRRATSRVDDYISVMTYALVNGVDKLSKIDHENPTGYLIKCIRGALIRFGCKDRLMCVGIEHAKKKGVRKLLFPDSIEEVVQCEGANFVELREILSKIKLSEPESAVLGAFLSGMGGHEIASSVKINGKLVTPKRIYQIRSAIKDRVMECMK